MALAAEETSCIFQMRVSWPYWRLALSLAGWPAKSYEGSVSDSIGDLVIGVIGAFIGDWLLPRIGIHLGTGIISAVANATRCLTAPCGWASARPLRRRLGRRLGKTPLVVAVAGNSTLSLKNAPRTGVRGVVARNSAKFLDDGSSSTRVE